MATFTGSRGGGSTGPYLTLDYNVVETDVANNRSKVRLVLKLNASHRINFSASKSGNLHGSAFTYTSGASGTGSWTLRSQDVWVGHNSDGSKSQSFSGSFNIAISYGGSNVSSLSVSGTATLPVIPRASTLSAFSFASQLQPSTAITINYTVDRKSSNFRHQIKLLDGSHEVQVWDNISSNGASALTLSTASVNSLLNRLSSNTSRSLTLRVATRSGVGGGWIGSAVTRNATINVHSNVAPTISGLSISQTGNSVSSHTLQGISRITASFTRGGGYGASISSETITVRRKGNNDDVQTINSNSGTTGRAITHSGTYQAQGMVRDSRGRTSYTAWTDIPVTAYSPPRITTFTATRNAGAQTTVNIVRNTTHTNLGTSNPLTFSVQRRLGTGAWTNVNTNPSGSYTTSPLTNGSSTSTGNSVTASYDFRLTITDKFNNKVESIMTVSTQRVVLDVHKNEGVGIGKVHEQGVLDVGGSAYFSEGVTITGPTYMEGGIQAKFIPSNTNLNNILDSGFYYNNSDAQAGTMSNLPVSNAFSLLVEKHAGVKQTFTRYNPNTPETWVRNYYSGSWGSWSRSIHGDRGANANGDWYRFDNGLIICIGTFSYDFSANTGTTRTLPTSMSGSFAVSIGAGNNSWQALENSSAVGAGPSGTSGVVFSRFNNASHVRVAGTWTYRYVAIGWL